MPKRGPVEVFRSPRTRRWLWRCLVCQPVWLDDEVLAQPSGSSRWWAGAMSAAFRHVRADQRRGHGRG